jgi:hypothetical protein
MTMAHNPLDVLVRGYHDDLAHRGRLAFDQLENADGHVRSTVRGIVVEMVRHNVYEELFLYPALRGLPGGEEIAGSGLAEIVRLEHGLESFSVIAVEDDGFRHALVRVMQDLQAHAARQEPSLTLLRDALGPDGLDDAGAFMVPTREAGTTHSMPAGITYESEAPWPAPGLVAEARQAFSAEVAAR